MKIFLKFIFIFCLFFSSLSGLANVNESAYLEQGNAFLAKALSGEYPEFKTSYLKKAQYYFYVASKNTPPSIDALIGLGRVYMIMDKQEDAKNALFRAYSIDPYNASANFYYAQYCYKYNDFTMALTYFKKAQDLGYRNDAEVADLIKKCYAKLGDEEELSKLEQN